MGTAVNAVD